MMCTGLLTFLQELSLLMCHGKSLKTGNILEAMNLENECVIHLLCTTKYVTFIAPT